jgi:hypothetical protein
MLKITFSKSRGLEARLGQVIKINSNVGSISAAELQRLNDESNAAAAQSLASSQQSAQSAVDAENSAAEAASWADVAGANFQAMNAVQFNAIRARNNEEFAASGFVHFGKQYVRSGYPAEIVNQGLFTAEAAALANAIALGNNSTYKSGGSKTDYPLINIAGIIFRLSDGYVTGYGSSWAVKFPEAPDGRTTYNKSTGSVTTYDHPYQAFAAAEADPTNIEVVTDRVDMWGFEAWLEEVSTANPFVYPNGLIQSQASTMDGITTSVSARPVTYYAVFDGDTGSKGRGVNFFALTDTQKKKVLANPKNNLYYLDDGRLVQWRLRQRTIAGAGNGDWSDYDANTQLIDRALSFAAGKNYVLAQGGKDTEGALGQYFDSTKHSANKTPFKGVYTGRSMDSFTANGECYFLVCGTVSRLNQGAYHPSYNSMGASMVQFVGSPNSEQFWSHPQVVILQSVADAFIYKSTTGGGSISKGSTFAGRPDGRFYDAIYADGQGGVCRDMRYSAYGVDSVDFAEADQRVKNGEYRGFEKLKVTAIVNESNKASTIAISGVYSDLKYFANLYSTVGASPFYNSKIYYLVNKTQDWIFKVDYSKYPNMAYNHAYFDKSLPATITDTIFVVYEKDEAISVGGSFLQTDVIGDPINILQTDALKNGWQGSWIPDLINTTVAVTRKALGNVVGNRLSTLVGGSTWAASSGISIEPVNNNIYRGYSAGAQGVTIFSYQAFAKQTEPANNIEVYGGESGVGVVWASNRSSTFDGALFCETLIGIPKSVHGDTTQIRHAIKYFRIDSNKLIVTSQVKHNPLFDGNGINANDSIAVKALDYNVVISNQAFKQYAATELKHDGTDWGDDSKIHIVDGESTMTDLNGNTVKVVTHKLKEPIGWIKNKV